MASIGMVTGRKYVAADSATPLTKRQLQDIKNMGANTIRIEFEDAQGTRGDRVQAYRNILQWSGEVGLTVIGVLAQSSMPDPHFSPGSTRDKADFEGRFLPVYLDAVRWHEQNYGAYGSLEGWEIFNEPDVPNHGWLRNPADRNTFMKDEIALTNVRVWEKIKAAGQLNHNRKVILTAMSHTDSERWLDMYNTDTMYYFRQDNNGDIPADIVGIHGYGQVWNPRATNYSIYNAGNFEGQLNRFFGFRDRTNRELVPPGKTLYMTELGVDSMQAGEADVASAMRFYYDTLNKFTRITKGFWYNYRDDEKPCTAADPCVGFFPDPNPNAYGMRTIKSTKYEGGIKAQSYNMMRNMVQRAGIGQEARFGAARQPFIAAFKRVDGWDNVLGSPGENGGGPWVHRWENGMVQDFKGALYSASGSAMITQEDGTADVAVVYGRFWDVWMANNGGPGVGFPFNNGGGADRHPWDSARGDKGFVQDLRKGGRHNAMLMFETAGPPGRINAVFIVTQPILGKYMAGGGVGAYGYARGERSLEGSRWKQTFAHGTIYE